MMLPGLPPVHSRLFFFLDEGVTVIELVLICGISSLSALVRKHPDEERTEGCTHRTYTAHQQRKNVEQASASSGNQCLLGHCSVPRFALFASDNSTNGDRAMFWVRARLASATIPVFEQAEKYAIRSSN